MPFSPANRRTTSAVIWMNLLPVSIVIDVNRSRCAVSHVAHSLLTSIRRAFHLTHIDEKLNGFCLIQPLIQRPHGRIAQLPSVAPAQSDQD